MKCKPPPKVKLTFNCGSVEDAVLEAKDRWVWQVGDCYTASDTLDLITWCDIGNIQISFYSEEDKKEFIKHVKEDLENYKFFQEKGREFLKGLKGNA